MRGGDRTSLGLWGEKQAARYLRKQGFQVLENRFRCREGEIDLIDATVRQTVRLEDYDCVGFASGVYFGKFHTSVLHAARQYLPHGKPVFFVCTYGGGMGQSTRELKELAGERGCAVLGTFGCKGYDTFGPFKLVGGLAKGRPDEGDLDRARGFFRDILTRL